MDRKPSSRALEHRSNFEWTEPTMSQHQAVFVAILTAAWHLRQSDMSCFACRTNNDGSGRQVFTLTLPNAGSNSYTIQITNGRPGCPPAFAGSTVSDLAICTLYFPDSLYPFVLSGVNHSHRARIGFWPRPRTQSQLPIVFVGSAMSNEQCPRPPPQLVSAPRGVK